MKRLVTLILATMSFSALADDSLLTCNDKENGKVTIQRSNIFSALNPFKFQYTGKFSIPELGLNDVASRRIEITSNQAVCRTAAADKLVSRCVMTISAGIETVVLTITETGKAPLIIKLEDAEISTTKIMESDGNRLHVQLNYSEKPLQFIRSKLFYDDRNCNVIQSRGI